MDLQREETHWSPPVCAPIWLSNHSLGVCSHQGLNPQPFGTQENTPANWATQQGLKMFSFYCSITVVPPITRHPHLPPPSTFNLPLPQVCLCPWVVYTCSLTTFPVFPLPFPLVTVSVFISMSLVLFCLFCWLGSTYRWDHMVFVFYHLAYFT